MRIGELAKAAHVTPRTIRYYERLGLIPKGHREGTGQHHYPETTIERLNRIDQLKNLGLSLEEIHAVIDLYFTDLSGKKAKSKVVALLKEHLEATETKISSLSDFREDLKGHIRRIEAWLRSNP